MGGDQSVHHLSAGAEPGERADLVLPDQPAVAGDVGRKIGASFRSTVWIGTAPPPVSLLRQAGLAETLAIYLKDILRVSPRI
jgi:hypothetical protein